MTNSKIKKMSPKAFGEKYENSSSKRDPFIQKKKKNHDYDMKTTALALLELNKLSLFFFLIFE